MSRLTRNHSSLLDNEVNLYSISTDTIEVTCNDKFLGNEVIGKLMNDLSTNNVTRRVTLRGNCIYSTGASMIAEALKSNKLINYLSLEWNQIQSDGANYIADALLINNNLTYLDLRNNSIDDSGAISLANALKSNSSLTTLDLRWNSIGDNGALAYKDVILYRNPTIKLLLDGNMISENVLNTLKVWITNPNQFIIAEERKDQNDNTVHSTDITIKAQNDILTREITILRNQNNSMNENISNLQRQIDTSAIRITELEQQLVKEDFINKHNIEIIKQLNEKIVLLNEEKRNLLSTWDIQRNDMLVEIKRIALEKDTELMSIKSERDNSIARETKAQEDIVRLSNQINEINNSINNERQITQNQLKQTLNQLNDLYISESKLRSENSTLINQVNQVNEKILNQSNQILLLEESHRDTLTSIMNKHKNEIIDITNDYNKQIELLSSINKQLSSDIDSNTIVIHDLNIKLSKQLLDQEQSFKQEIVKIRNLERQSYTSLENDLKQRIQMLETSLHDIENRYEKLQLDSNSGKDDQVKLMKLNESRMISLENDIKEYHSNSLLLKDQLNKCNKEKALSVHQLDDVMKENHRLLESITGYKGQINELSDKQTLLKSTIQTLQHQLDQIKSLRLNDFTNISNHIQSVIANELENLQYKLDLKQK